MREIGPIPSELERAVHHSSDRAFARFEDHDSGCRSYGIEAGGNHYFVKSSHTPGGRASLLNGLRFHDAVQHRAIVHPLGATIEEEVTVVYPWLNGAVLNQATVRGSDRTTLRRFHRLPLAQAQAALKVILDAHVNIASLGFVSVDFYDGATLYDFDRHETHLIDLDEYRPGPFTVPGDRLPGSRSYMAPEEFSEGAVIDERTMVFTLGRTIEQLVMVRLSIPTSRQAAVVERATDPNPAVRFETIAELVEAWLSCHP